MSPADASVECRECGATYVSGADACPVCGLPNPAFEAPPAESEAAPADACPKCGAAEAQLARFDDGSFICQNCDHVSGGEAQREVDRLLAQEDATASAAPDALATPSVATSPPRASFAPQPPGQLPHVAPDAPPVDPQKERETLYRAAFSEVEDDWEDHRAKVRRMKMLASIETGVFQASLAVVITELLMYFISWMFFFSGALGAEFFVTRAESITLVFLLLGLIFLLAVLFLFQGTLFGEDRPKQFWLLQVLTFILFAPPFFMVLFGAGLPPDLAAWIGLSGIGIAMVVVGITFQKRLRPSPKDFPFFLGLWIGGMWVFLMVQVGVLFRELLISSGTPGLPIGFGFYLHFGIFDVYLMLLAAFFCGLGYMNIRPNYIAREAFDDSLGFGVEAYIAGSYEGGLAYFNRAIRTGEEMLRRKWRLLDLDIAWMGRGACEMRLRKVDDAAASVKMASKLNPAKSVSWNMLGICLMENRELDKAGDAFRRAIEIDPKYAEAYNNIGNIFYLMRRYEDALKYYQAAIDLEKKYKDAWMNMGYTYLALGRHKEAIKCSNEAMKIGGAAI